jgi:hypothetical protein
MDALYEELLEMYVETVVLPLAQQKLVEVEKNFDAKTYIRAFAGLEAFPQAQPVAKSYELETLAGYQEGTTAGMRETKPKPTPDGTQGIPEKTYWYKGTGWHPPGFRMAFYSFDQQQWSELEAEFNRKAAAGEPIEGAEGEATIAPETMGVVPYDPNIPAVDQAIHMQAKADEAAQAYLQRLKQDGILLDADGQESIAKQFRQLYGVGSATILSRMANRKMSHLWKREGEEWNPPTAFEVESNAKETIENMFKAMKIANDLKINPSKVSREDKEWVRKCFVLRGRSQDPSKNGVYTRCGTNAAEGHGVDDRGSVYGIRLENGKGPFYQMMEEVSKSQTYKGNPLVYRGATDGNTRNTFAAIYGDMAEYMPTIAWAMGLPSKAQRRSQTKKVIKEMVANMGETFDLQLFLTIAEANNAGEVPDVRNWLEDGCVDLLSDVAQDLGLGDEAPDAKASFLWVVARGVKRTQALQKFVSENGCSENPPKKVGGGPTGFQKDGSLVNADNEWDCGEETVKSVMEKARNDARYAGDKKLVDKATLRASLKNSESKSTTALGKRSNNRLNGELADIARKTQLSYLRSVADGFGHKLPDDIEEKVLNMKAQEVEVVQGILESVEAAEAGATLNVLKNKKSAVPYDAFINLSELEDSFIKYRKAKDPSEKRKLRASLECSLTNAYRLSQYKKNPKVFSHWMAVEQLITGSSTEAELFMLADKDSTWLGTESDVIGKAACMIAGIGVEEGEGWDIKFLQNGPQWYDKEGGFKAGLLDRMKAGLPSQFSNLDSDWVKSQLRKV